MERVSFIKYSLAIFLTFVGVIGTFTVNINENSWPEKLGWTLVISLGITIILAPIFYWLHPKTTARYRRKKTKKKLFLAFIEKHNFKILDDGHVVGKIDEFIIIMHAARNEFQNTKWIQIQIIFNPKRKNQYIEHSLLSRMIRKYNEKSVTWYINSILIKQVYSLRMPKYDVIYPLLKRCISDLKGNYIEPISYKDWERMIPETKEYLDKLEKL